MRRARDCGTKQGIESSPPAQHAVRKLRGQAAIRGGQRTAAKVLVEDFLHESLALGNFEQDLQGE
jgi:hypothetical protein